MKGESEQTGDAAVVGNIDVDSGGDLGQAGHGHDAAADDHHKAGAGSQTDLPDIHAEAGGGSLEGGVVAEAVLGLGDADREIAVAHGGQLVQGLGGGGGVVHPVGAVDLAGHSLDLLPERGLQGIGELDGTVLQNGQDSLGQGLAALAALGEHFAQDAGHTLILAEAGDNLLFLGGVGGEGVDGHHHGQAETVLHVLDVAAQIGQAGPDSVGVGLVQVSLGHAAVALEGPDGGHQDAGRGGDAGSAALDVQELLGAQIGAETGLGDHIVGQGQAQTGGHDAVAAVGDVGEGTAVDDGGVVLQGLDQVGVDGVLQQGGHGAGCADLAGRHRLAVVSVGADNPGQAGLQIGQAGSQAEDGHHFAGHRDVKAVLPGGAVGLAAQAVHDEPQLTVVHIHAALPGDPAGIDVEGVALLDAVVDHGSQQIVGGADGVDVAGEVEVDVLHRDHLGIAAAGCAALDAKDGAQGRLTEAEHGLFAQGAQGVGQAHAGGGLALAGGGGADGGDQDHLALLGGVLGQMMVDFGLVAAVGDDVGLVQAQLGGDFSDGAQGSFLCNLDVRLHSIFSFADKQKGQRCAAKPRKAAQTVGFDELSVRMW